MYKKFIIIFTVFVALAGISFVYVQSKPYLRVRLYLGDRITGTFSMAIEGNKYVPVNKTIKFEGKKSPLLTDGDNFRFRGGNYGIYEIESLIENKALFKATNDPIFLKYGDKTQYTISYYNTDWWHITNIKVNADIIKDKNGEWIINTKVHYGIQWEDGSLKEFNVAKSYRYAEIASNGKAVVHFGM